MSADKRMDFDDRESSDDLLVKGMSEEYLDNQLKAIYGEDQYQKLFGEPAQQ